MTGKILNKNESCRTYGGEITLFDFEGHNTMSSMAKKIVKDWAFDKRCRLNAEIRDSKKKGYIIEINPPGKHGE